MLPGLSSVSTGRSSGSTSHVMVGVLGPQVHATISAFFLWVPGIWTLFLRLAHKLFHPWNHLPGPWLQFLGAHHLAKASKAFRTYIRSKLYHWPSPFSRWLVEAEWEFSHGWDPTVSLLGLGNKLRKQVSVWFGEGFFPAGHTQPRCTYTQ